MPDTASGISVSASLIDDYLQASTPPVTGDVANNFVAVQAMVNGQPFTELLTTNSDNTQVLDFYRDPTAGAGWNQLTTNITPLEGTGPIDQLIAFYQQGVLNVQVRSGSSLMWWYRDAPGNPWACVVGWDYLPARPQPPNLYVGADGNPLVYFGLGSSSEDSEFFLCRYDAAWGNSYPEQWASAPQDVPVSPAYLIMNGYAGNPYALLWASGATICYRSFSLSGMTIEWGTDDPGESFALPADQWSVDQFYALPAAAAPTGFLVRGNGTQLYWVSGFAEPTPSISSLTGQTGQPEGANTVTLGVDAQNMCTVFAVDTNQQLWVLRQTGTDSYGNAAFGAWVLLGDTLAGITSPLTMLAGPEVFAVDEESELVHLSQGPDGTWCLETLATPTPATEAPQDTATYTWDVQAVDANGAPVPSTAVTITASRATVLVANGLAYYSDPDTPAAVFADATGKLTLAAQATDLSAPLLEIGVGGQTMSCPGDLQMLNRMAGGDPTFAVTGSTLQQQGLIPTTFDSSQADALASYIRSAAQTMVALRQAGSPNFSGVEQPSFGLDWSAPGSPRLLSADEVSERVAAARRAAPYGGWLSSIWGDVKHGFSQAISDLKSIAVQVTDQIEITVEDMEADVQSFVLTTVDQVADVLELIFQKINDVVEDVEAFIEKVIAWLKLLFDWSDIVNTHLVLQHYANGALSSIIDTVDDTFVTWAQSGFSAAQSVVSAAFTQAASLFGEGVSFNQFANGIGGGSGTAAAAMARRATASNDNVLAGGSYQTAYAGNRAQCNYVWSKATTYYSSSSASAAAIPGAADDAWSHLLSLVQAQMSALEEQVQALMSYLGQTASNPQGFFDLLITDFLAAADIAVTAVLDFVEDVVVAALDLVASAIQALQNTLTFEPDIPIVSWLYQKYVGSPLSILDLLCLIVAVPTTIIYKLIFGSAPFTSEQVSAITGSPIPWPSLPWGDAASPAPGALAGASPASVLSVVAGVIYFVYTAIDAANDAMAASAQAAVEMPILSTVLTWADIVVDVIVQALTVPYEAMKRGFSSPADKPTVVLWCLGFLPPLLNTLSAILSGLNAGAKYVAGVGPVLISAAGLLMLGFGVATSTAQAADPNYSYTQWNLAQNILDPIPDSFTFLLSFTAESVGITAVILAVLAGLCDLGTAVTMFEGALVSPPPGAGTSVLSFTGQTGYVSVPAIAALDTCATLTVSAWVCLDAECGPNMKVVAGSGFILGIGEGDYSGSNTYRTLYPEIWVTGSDGSSVHYTFQDGVIPMGKWTQLTLSWSQGAGLFQGSINGQAVQSLTVPVSPLAIGDGPVVLGLDQDLGSFALDALLSRVTIGVSSNANAYTAEWPLDEGSGTTAHDTSGNGNTGTIGGTGWNWTTVSSGPPSSPSA